MLFFNNAFLYHSLEAASNGKARPNRETGNRFILFRTIYIYRIVACHTFECCKRAFDHSLRRSSRDASPSSESDEWVIVPNGNGVNQTGSPAPSPGGSGGLRPPRPARPPPPTPRRPTASPGRRASSQKNYRGN